MTDGKARLRQTLLACIGMARFPTFTLAERIRRRRGAHKRDDARHVYRCRVCRGFHIGSNPERGY